jgi:hypothetical protein
MEQIMRPTLFFVFLALAGSLGGAGAQTAQNDPAALDQAVDWIRQSNQVQAQYDYQMTVRIRLLFFWVTREDVGGGYIRRARSATDPQLETIAVLFGSDPTRAKGINRWGAGTEVLRRSAGAEPKVEASAFMGFMKASKGASASEMQHELANEKTSGQHVFEANVTRVDAERAVARVTNFTSDRDFTLHELGGAQQVALDRVADSTRPVRRLEEKERGCLRLAGFLATVQELLDHALAGKAAGASLCYLYNARRYTATLKSYSNAGREVLKVNKAEAVYHNLLRARFQVLNHQTGKTSDFDLLVPQEGPLRGIPVQIIHQPNWWFQIVLNLAKSG